MKKRKFQSNWINIIFSILVPLHSKCEYTFALAHDSNLDADNSIMAAVLHYGVLFSMAQLWKISHHLVEMSI